MQRLTCIRYAMLIGTLMLLVAVLGRPGVSWADGHTGARPGSPGDAIPPITFGLFDGRIGEMKALKTGWTRVAAHWGSIEPVEGAYDWSALDAKIRPATRAGIRVIVAVHSNSPWGSNCGGRFSVPLTAKMPAFRAFVRALVERYDDDGVDDMPGLTMPVRHYQVENQWVTAVFYRGSDNCSAQGFGDPGLVEIGVSDGARVPPEVSGNPRIAANDFVREYRAVDLAAGQADADALVGVGNIPTQTSDAALFCLNRLGPRFPQNILNRDGSVKETIEWTRPQICKVAGVNTRYIKTWVRYWNVVLETAMPKIKNRVDFIDLAQYGRYQYVPLRNQWVTQRARAWGYARAPLLVAWEMAGPDRRVLVPGPNPDREVALDLVKRTALGFASDTRVATWFHYQRNDAAAIGVRFTSLLDGNRRRLPAYWNYRLLVNQVVGAESATLEELGTAKNRGYLAHFDFANGKRVTVAWADGGLSTTVDVSQASVQVIRATGRRTMPAVVKPAPGKRLTLNLSATPTFIVQ